MGIRPQGLRKNVGNIEICYKICKALVPNYNWQTNKCVAWTYNVKTYECKTYDDKTIEQLDRKVQPFNYETNPHVSGPKDCGYA